MNRSLTAVSGLLAGHWTHPAGRTGTTAVLFPRGAVGAAFVPGSASGTRELEALAARHLTGVVHGICLSGGSAFGLAAADGVMEVLASRGIGFPTPGGVVPIVPAAILYDLDQGPDRPDRASGAAAARAATAEALPDGRVGAGAGATVAKLAGGSSPGGFGGWATALGPHTVAAGVALNALGSIRDPQTGEWRTDPPPQAVRAEPGTNTTLAVVATDAPLDRAGCQVLARMAAAGMARAIWPAFSPFDGDTVFAASTGSGPAVDPATLTALGSAAADCLGRAICRALPPSTGL